MSVMVINKVKIYKLNKLILFHLVLQDYRKKTSEILRVVSARVVTANVLTGGGG